MAQKYLGDYFDIHCGGEDHIPVHHTNEIAQTEARVGTRLANFWMHGYFLLLNDAKMAKSAGEFLRVQSLLERGYDPLVYRYLCLTAHYRTQMSFSWEAMDAAATALDRMRNGFHALPRRTDAQPDAAYVERFTDEINDDLNVPRALAVAWEVLRGDLPPAVRRATLAQVRRRARARARRLGAAPRTSSPRKCRRSPMRGPRPARRSSGPRPTACARNSRPRAGRWKTSPPGIVSGSGSAAAARGAARRPATAQEPRSAGASGAAARAFRRRRRGSGGRSCGFVASIYRASPVFSRIRRDQAERGRAR